LISRGNSLKLCYVFRKIFNCALVYCLKHSKITFIWFQTFRVARHMHVVVVVVVVVVVAVAVVVVVVVVVLYFRDDVFPRGDFHVCCQSIKYIFYVHDCYA